MKKNMKLVVGLLIGLVVMMGRGEAQETLPYPENKGYYFGDFSLLIWQANSDNFNYAAQNTTSINIPNPPKDLDTNFSFQDADGQDLHFSPGVRAAIGYSRYASNWSYILEGTFFHTRNKSSKKAPITIGNPFSYITPTLNQSFSGFAADEASGSWTLNYTNLDLLAAYNILCCERLVLMPSFGLRASIINNHFVASYENVTYPFNDPDTGVAFATAPHSETDVNNQTVAGGLKGGIDFSVPFLRNWNLFGGFAGSLLYGQYNLKEKIFGYVPEITTSDPPVNALNTIRIVENDRVWRCNTNFEGELGFSYLSCCKWFEIQVSLSYFFSYWVNQSYFYNLTFSPTPLAGLILFENFFDFEKKNTNLLLNGFALSFDFIF